MRSRAVLLVVAIALVAAFAALNWSEFVRPSPLLIGPVVTDAPLGLIMLVLLGLATVAYILSTATIRTRSLMESKHHYKTLEAQRELADKAEASRFTDLRQHLDAQLRELRQRDAIAATEFEKSMVQGQRELRTQLEQMNRMLAARLTEMEHRMAGRPAQGMGTPPVLQSARNEPMHPAVSPSEHALAHPRPAPGEQLREQQLREERAQAADRAQAQQLQDDRMHAEREREDRAHAGPRAESGWRRWF